MEPENYPSLFRRAPTNWRHFPPESEWRLMNNDLERDMYNWLERLKSESEK